MAIQFRPNLEDEKIYDNLALGYAINFKNGNFKYLKERIEEMQRLDKKMAERGEP
jgi:hypothetical protein